MFPGDSTAALMCSEKTPLIFHFVLTVIHKPQLDGAEALWPFTKAKNPILIQQQEGRVYISGRQLENLNNLLSALLVASDQSGFLCLNML